MSRARQIFIDSNVVVALLDAKDSLHTRAAHLWNKVSDEQLFFSDIVINEVLSVLAKRFEARKSKSKFQTAANDFFAFLQDQPILCLYELVAGHLPEIKKIMSGSQGQFNFHDALILFFLKQVPNVELATLDKDFFDSGISLC